ncbi:hypothetical protein HZQ14_15755 [Elizabethkingia anophelis]|nr:hypothetical protein [Elizabethkingia anophelis]
MGSNGFFSLWDGEGNFITSSEKGGIIEWSTGLLDRKENKIFEGDKIKPEEEESENIVRWDVESAMFVLDIYGFDYHIGEGSQEVYDNEFSLVDTMNFSDIAMEHIEVIGNIHESLTPNK